MCSPGCPVAVVFWSLKWAFCKVQVAVTEEFLCAHQTVAVLGGGGCGCVYLVGDHTLKFCFAFFLNF